MDDHDPIETEIAALLDEILRRTGHDFRNYARGSRRRRLETLVAAAGLPGVAALRRRLDEEPGFVERLLQALSVPATAMFRDPEVWLALRTRVMPHLATYPTIRVWLAGCATGEEAWSLAILLEEAGLAERSRLYATDINAAALERARAGIFPIAAMQEHTRCYQRSGGQGDFSRYYTAAYANAKFDAGLGRNLVFAQHNLAVDRSFNEFQLILCRNVLIYFDELLQARVHRLLHDSLVHLGVLCLGAQERLDGLPWAGAYQDLDPVHRLYRKVAEPPGEIP
jgi:chemotaxis protein methyltransferase CheR